TACHRDVHDLTLVVAVNQTAQMIRPTRKRGFHLRRVRCAIVDAGDSALVPTDMIYDRLDDMRLDSDLAHAGDKGAAEIVQAPLRDVQPLIERILRNDPSREAGHAMRTE